MTLGLAKIVHQVDHMGRELAMRAMRERHALPAARELLHQFAHDADRLRQIATSEDGRRLRCAHPADEPLDQAFSSPVMVQEATLIAADGSQVFPDRHGLAFYFLLNVGHLVFRHGSGRAPEAGGDARLFYTDEEVYPGGEPVSADLVGALRGLLEMQALADLAAAEPTDGPPCLAMGDGPLLIWLERAAIPQDDQRRIFADYVACLDRMRRLATPVAGFVSRPRSAEVVALLYLAHLEADARRELRGLHDTPFRGLTDRALFGALRQGERSALFVRGAAANEEFRARGHLIYFFYLNTGTDVARVEVPEWVALHPARLDLVHAAVVDQCEFNNGYPYVLTRADEQAVILSEEREVLEEMIAQAMARHGLELPEFSRKAQQKQVARWRRR